MTAVIYQRMNGKYAASCNGTQDTGHHIIEKNGWFTVYSIKDDETVIARNAPREQAAKAIEIDWANA